MKDKIRYSEAFKLKVMEELRDAKWKSVKEVATAYGIAEMSVYNWMHKLGFEHLKGRLIYVKTRTETDRIKELEAEVKRLRMALADDALDPHHVAGNIQCVLTSLPFSLSDSCMPLSRSVPYTRPTAQGYTLPAFPRGATGPL